MADMFPILFSTHGLPDILRVIRQHGSEAFCIQIPWAMIEAHEDQAIKNHSQSIRRLAERGGLSTRETLAVLRDEPYRNDMGYGSSNALLLLEVQRWHEAIINPTPATRAVE